MAEAYLRGRRIVEVGFEWVYADTRDPTAGNPRSCGQCSDIDRVDGHDACLGELPGLMNACCGHGIGSGAYVQFLDGFTLRGEDAIEVLDALKRGAER